MTKKKHLNTTIPGITFCTLQLLLHHQMVNKTKVSFQSMKIEMAYKCLKLDFSQLLSVSLRRGLNGSIPYNGFVLRTSKQYHFVPEIKQKNVFYL